MDFKSGTFCRLDDLHLSWSSIYDKDQTGSAYTDDRGGQVLLNKSGRMAVVYNKSSVTVHSLDSRGSVAIDGLVGVKSVTWCPHSHLDSHLTVLCSSGRMFLYRIDSNTASIDCILQCETVVRSVEDATLRPISCTHSHDSIFVLLENGDVLKVSPWMPIPSLIPKSLLTDQMTVSHTEYDLALVTAVKGTPKTSLPCLVQPEPLEPTGNYKEIELVSYRGVDLLLVSCGQTRIDILLVIDSSSAPLLVLLESIELAKPSKPTDILSTRPFPSTQPALLLQQGSQVFLVKLTWADQLVDSIIYDVNIDLIKSHMRLVGSGVQAAFPLVNVLDGSLECLTIVKGERSIVKLQENSIAPPSAVHVKPQSSIADVLDKKPVHKQYEQLTVEFKTPSLPNNISGLKLPDLTEDSLITLLDSAVDPLRGDSIASLVAASSALLGLLEQIDEAIEKQGSWLAELKGRLEAHQTKMNKMQEKMSQASDKWTTLQTRHQSIIDRLSSGHVHSEVSSYLLDSLKSLTDQLPAQQKIKSPKEPTDQDVRQGTPISASIKDLCSRVSRLST